MWTLRSRIIFWHRSQKTRILRGRSATTCTSRGVLEAYSSQKPQFATARLSMWKGAPNNAEGTAKQCIGGDDVLLLYLAPFFKLHSPKCGDPTLGVKANWSAPECSSSKADELKAEFSAEWLRIWRYERGKKNLKKGATWNPFCRTVFRTLGEKGFPKGFFSLYKLVQEPKKVP